jgi:hypothetical protein
VSAVFENLEVGARVDQIAEGFNIAKGQVIEVLDHDTVTNITR